MPVPPRTEQDQIVRYLDWQVSKINRLIAAKKQEIALFEESKINHIANAVLHGVRHHEHCIETTEFGSLILILLSVFFWFMGYNAVTTAYSKYFALMWGDVSGAAQCLTVATVGAVVSYIPVGHLSSRFGRKKMILIGVALLAACFAAAGFVKEFSFIIYVLFVLVGFAWASIGVNSYPMVVEISRAGDVGKYTGYYYTFSMAGQIITPILSGQLLEHMGYHTLFPYAAVMVLIALGTMLFVRHGDSRPVKAASALETFDTED